MIAKYRGKRIDNGEWVYGSLIERSMLYGSQYSILVRGDEDTIDNEIDVYYPSVGMWTGKVDAGKQEVYEGHILENDGEWYTVEWDEHSLQWEAQGIGDTESIALAEIVSESWIQEKYPGSVHD